MKTFQCGNCKYSLTFESVECSNCGHKSGYRDSDNSMLTFDPSRSTFFHNIDQTEYKYCKNKNHEVCNWLIKTENHNEFCPACQLNRTIPNLTNKKNFKKWRNLEIAKHQLIYQLQKFGLSLPSKIHNKEEGLCFDFVSKQNNPSLMTGHASGVITILLREADSVLREQIIKELREPYRTLIGHLRHEVGHYFWDRLVFTNKNTLSEFRIIFGNEELNYSEALQNYYKTGAPEGWNVSFISKYATSHPWEDWAETWAHYLHIMDMAETAYYFGLEINPINQIDLKADVSFDPYTVSDFTVIV